MINTLRIQRFKSIKELRLVGKRVNVFIGQPNTGKSNILESIGFLSFLYYSRYGYALDRFVRCERTSNLFYDENLDHPVEIVCDGTVSQLAYGQGGFEGSCRVGDVQAVILQGDHNQITVHHTRNDGTIAHYKSYRFLTQGAFPRRESDFLMPPSGENLVSLLLAHKDLRDLVSQLFLQMGLRLVIRPQESKLELVKQVDDVIIAYPYSLASETLQRLTFYLAAILTNKQSVLAFEEPESHAFPYYTKYLAELIALDQNQNQYFIATHNPYFLLPLLEKTAKSELAVHIVYFENYETKVKVLTEQELSELGELDVFSNLERYVEKA
ncbi:MAG: AAA family ATPase [Chloroflexi bacterium]|nr:AAA family ATPase [Chloroflexota bacterium]